MKSLITLFSGLIFGLGLIISGMANPMKVQNFLDVYGAWDASLAFVMGGAIAITMPGYRLIFKRQKPFFHNVFDLPVKSDFDIRLVAGAIIFGIGWGLGGFCPGPALTALPVAASGTFVFVSTMLTGMWIAKYVSPSIGKTIRTSRWSELSLPKASSRYTS